MSKNGSKNYHNALVDKKELLCVVHEYLVIMSDCKPHSYSIRDDEHQTVSV